jgi:hypothetical protein
MKTKTLLCGAVFFVAVLACAGSFTADEKKSECYVPKRTEEIYGTWVNEKYDGIN